MSQFIHLHVHTQYSILDGASKIDKLINKTKELGMKSIAITDHGNMFGVMDFVSEANKAGIKPIIGVEAYIARNGVNNKTAKEDRSGYHLVLLAKNMQGYKNLIKLVSKSYLEGFYYTPRMDKEWFLGYSEGIIALSGCLGGEIPRMLKNRNTEEAEKSLQSYIDIFGENFYLELQNQGYEDQQLINVGLRELSDKYNVQLVATNDVHFVNKDDYDAHKLLISINTSKDISEDTMYYTGNEFLRSYNEMLELFPGQEEILANTVALADQIEEIKLTRDIIMPDFPIPADCKDDDAFLEKISYEGVKKKYGEVSQEIDERLKYELDVIKDMGYAGYFLIVQDLINAARKMDVIVGPGRGSVAGSLIAYTIGITNIDPIEYKLLFERFLNPERISMPDIDIDFDDEGREQVFKYVIEKYGKEKVAQIITFGTLGARMAIRDVARVMGADLSLADKLAKMIPETPGSTISNTLKLNTEFNEIANKGADIEKKIIVNALKLEGAIRQTSVHACGVIIGRDNLTEHIPLAIAKNASTPITQYEGSLVESAGMLKMDFLGLKTLSIIKDAIKNIEKRHKLLLKIDDIPFDDTKSLELFQRGDTVGVFQFESEGMRKWLKELKPTTIEDLIAMNALYRPATMDFIQLFVNRKHRKEKTEYPHPLLEDILKDTYGIMVYQEQIMLAAQILAGYSLGSADILRDAMGKKKIREMAKQKDIFIKGAFEKNNIPNEKAEKIFEQIQDFAKYGFNRSHSAAYSVVAFHTAYLKAHYPAEYMASVLTHNLSDIKKITFFIDESKKMGINVLGPDVNESDINFMVDSEKNIRFGLSALKNVGENAAKSIIDERTANGNYFNFQDFLKRMSIKSINKRSIESLAYAGAFDNFGIHRARFFHKENDIPFIDILMKHATYLQNISDSNQQTLFGDTVEETIPELMFPQCEEFSQIECCKYEKEITGFYINAHPLDTYKIELNFCNTVPIDKVKNAVKPKENIVFSIAGIIKDAKEKITKNNKKYGGFFLEDETGSMYFNMFGDNYLKHQHLIKDSHFVVVNASFQKNFKNDKIELRINEISMLHDVENKIRNIETRINLSQLESIFMDLIENVKNNPGDKFVKFVFVDDNTSENDEPVFFNATMPKKKVGLGFVKFLEDNDIKYKLS